MRRWLLVALLVGGVLCAGAGIALDRDPFGAASFGWTAYSPLMEAPHAPLNLGSFRWAHEIGIALLAVGAGATGAALTALVLDARARGRDRSKPTS